MDPQAYLTTLKARFKDYTHLKTLLSSSTIKDEFDGITNDVLNYIQNDTIMYSEFSRTYNIPAVDKVYVELSNFSRNLVEYLYLFKKLRGF